MLCVVLAALLATTVVWTGCSHEPSVKPKTVVVSCADDNFYIAGIKWDGWHASAAAGTGVGHVNNCTPNCAAGKFKTYPVSITFSDPVTCVKGRREYARVSWHWTATKPKDQKSTDDIVFPCSFLKLKP